MPSDTSSSRSSSTRSQTIDPAAGTSYSYDIEPYTIPKASNVRFVFVSDSGEDAVGRGADEPARPGRQLGAGGRAAREVQGLGEDVKEFRLKRLLIFTDLATTLYLGEIKLVTDNTPIKVDPLGEPGRSRSWTR